jgi:VWFA-related protein
LSLGLVAVLGLLIAGGCSTTSSSGTTPAPAPSGTTSIEVGSGGSANLTVNSKTGACSIIVVDQNQNPITSTNNLNIQNITIQVWSTTTTSQTASVGTLTYNGGSAGSAVSYAMTLDRSGSMDQAENASLEAAAAAFVNNSGATDQGAIVNFGGNIFVDQGLTTNKSLLLTAVGTPNASIDTGYTALFDSMGTAVSTVAAGSNTRKAVIAMTDGGENHSSVYTSKTAVITHANASNIPIYCVGLGITQGSYDEQNLIDISSGTGGLYYYSPNTASLTDLYNKISTALGSSWTIDFTSPVTFVTGTTYYILITVTYEGGITNSVLYTVTL